MRLFFAVFLLMHGIAHLVGFVVPWKLAEMEDAPYKTTIFLDKIDLGDTGIRINGVGDVCGLTVLSNNWAYRGGGIDIGGAGYVTGVAAQVVGNVAASDNGGGIYIGGTGMVMDCAAIW